MKRILMLAVCYVVVVTTTAQKFDDLKKFIFIPGQEENAKTEIDKIASDPKFQGKAEVWLWKAKVYSLLFKNEKTRSKYPNIEVSANEAYQKYLQLEPNMDLLNKNNLRDIPFDIYQTAFSLGVKTYQAKNWDTSAYYFKMAVVYSDDFYKNKWASSTASMDTTSILYTGIAYQNANKTDEAYAYFSRLTDSAVGGKDFETVYRFVITINITRKNEAEVKRYIKIAKKIYPDESWEDYDIDYINKNYSLAEKTALFDKEDAAGNFDENGYLRFGDGFAHLSENDKATLDSTKIAAYQKKAAEAFKKAFGKNPQNAIAAFNVGVIYYNEFGEYDDRTRANIRQLQELNTKKLDEKDPKKRAAFDIKNKPIIDSLKKANADMEKNIMDAIDVSSEWMEKSFAVLKDKANKINSEKNVLNKTVDFLANIYQYKRDKAKGKDQKAYDAFDAKYKQFDALHDKY